MDFMKEFDYGSGYCYVFDFEEGVGGFWCLLDGLVGIKFYELSG